MYFRRATYGPASLVMGDIRWAGGPYTLCDLKTHETEREREREKERERVGVYWPL